MRKRVILNRDCQALLIPSAVPISIPNGTMVIIVQELGGTVTVDVNGQLARIEASDRDALGFEAQAPVPIKPKCEVAAGPVDIDSVWDALRQCYDPEIPVNIVDLGLIYRCESVASNDGRRNHVTIEMTLTAPGCGMGPVIAQDAEKRIAQLDNVTDITIDIVFEPVWSQDRMSEAAKLELGLL